MLPIRTLNTALRSPFLSTTATSTRTFTTFRHLLQDPAKTKVSSNYNRPPVPRSRASNSQLPVAPLVFIFVFGSGCFYYITKSRDGLGRPGGHQPIPDHTPESKKDWPRNTASDQTLSRR